MTVSCVAFVKRLAHLSPDEFKARYDQHLQLIQSLFGPAFPVVNRRHYLSADRTGMPPTVQAPSADIDAVTYNEWRDEQHYRDFMAKYAEVYEQISQDEKAFLDQEIMSCAYCSVGETKPSV